MSNAWTLRGADGRRDAARGTAPRWLRPALAAVTAACALVLAGRFVAQPLLTIHHVVVQSDLALTDAQVLSLAGLRGTERWYSVPTAEIARRLAANPLVRRAEVRRVFPDTLRLVLHARTPAGLVLASRGGRTVPVLVDGAGVLYKVAGSGADADLPIVAGIAAGDTALGQALPEAARALFAELAALRAATPALFALLSEVRVAGAAPAPDREMVLYLTCAPVPVRARGALDEPLLRSTLMVLDLLSRQGILKDITALDVRGGDAVYTLRTAATGGDPRYTAEGGGGGGT